MIEALTLQQQSHLAEWRDKWIAIGLSCEPCNVEQSKVAIEAVYRSAGLVPPRTYLVFDSPLSAAIGATMKNQAQVGAQVGAQVWDQVRDQVWDQVRAQVYGSHDAGWLSFYDFFLRVVGLEVCRPLEGLCALVQHCGWWAPYRDVAILQHRHAELHRNDRGQLHHPSGMAVKYRDGWGVWALNGVRVPAALVETPADQLDARQWVMSEPNAEIRREAVRKIGIERVCAALGAVVIDRGTDHAGQPCELLILDLGDDRTRPYIKLRNPSIGVYHIEGVHPDCTTIEAAFRFRNGQKGAPEWIQ